MARVLVVDDDEDLRVLVRTVLVRRGHEVEVAVDGVEAWERMQDEDFDLAVVDRTMPGPSGIELIRAARRHRDLFDLPIVMLTASAGDDEVEEGLDAGATVYLTKPFSPAQLAAAVSWAFREQPDERSGD